MLLPKFDFHEPQTVPEACQILSEFGRKASPIAGGTDLLVNMKKKIVSPEHLVSLSRIEALTNVEKTNGVIKIGACVTVAELAANPVIRNTLGALSAGAAALGSPLIRNLATIGGNLGSASPAADLPPSLLVYGAAVLLESSRGERRVALADFLRLPGATACQPDECITQVHVPVPPRGSGAAYINLGVRKAQDCNLVNVASFVRLDENGDIAEARVAMGCVGPAAMCCPAAANILVGQKPDDALFEQAAEAAQSQCMPRGLIQSRASGEYKRAMVGVLARRTLNMAFRQARENGN